MTFKEQCQREWVALQRASAGNDYAIALFGRKIRMELAKGLGKGNKAELDQLFMQFAHEALVNCKPDVLLAKALSLDDFAEEYDWVRFSGWKGIKFLTSLTAGQRTHLLPMMPGAGPYGPAMIKANAKRLGIEIIVVSAGVGRPTNDTVSAQKHLLSDFVMSLYQDPRLRKLLPVMSTKLLEALSTPQRKAITRPGARA